MLERRPHLKASTYALIEHVSDTSSGLIPKRDLTWSRYAKVSDISRSLKPHLAATLEFRDFQHYWHPSSMARKYTPVFGAGIGNHRHIGTSIGKYSHEGENVRERGDAYRCLRRLRHEVGGQRYSSPRFGTSVPVFGKKYIPD